MISIRYAELGALTTKFYRIREMFPTTERDRYIQSISIDVHRTLAKLHRTSTGISEWTGSQPISVTLDEVTVHKIEEVYDWMKEK